MKNLVILGGGYGGMKILSELLEKKLPEDIHITLINKYPYHSLKTENYALAAGMIPEHRARMSFPDHPQLSVIFDEITGIQLDEETVSLKTDGNLKYDQLIIGLGCEDNYQNVRGAEEYTYSIQSLNKALETFQAIKQLPTGAIVSIIGAGLTGVELTSALQESRSDLKILLFDRGKHILSSFPERLSVYVESWFDNHDVEIVTYANITGIEKNVLFNHNEPIHSDIIIWTAGIKPNKVINDLNVEKDRLGRVILTPHHHLPGYENVFVVGDCASLPYAPSAQLAEAQGVQIAEVLWKKWNGEDLPDRLPPIKLKGVIGALGKKQGFGLVGDHLVTGRMARLLKSGVLWKYKYHKG